MEQVGVGVRQAVKEGSEHKPLQQWIAIALPLTYPLAVYPTQSEPSNTSRV